MQWIRGLQTQMNVCTFEVFYKTNAYLMHVALLVYSHAQYNLENVDRKRMCTFEG